MTEQVNSEKRGCRECFEVEWHIRGCGKYSPRNAYPVLESERSPERHEFVPFPHYSAKFFLCSVAGCNRAQDAEVHQVVAVKYADPCPRCGHSQGINNASHCLRCGYQLPPQPQPEAAQHLRAIERLHVCPKCSAACLCKLAQGEQNVVCEHCALRPLEAALSATSPFPDPVPTVTASSKDVTLAPVVEAPAVAEVCKWTCGPYVDCEIWETDCGEAFVFETDGPKENKMKFCCYCGKPLTEVIHYDEPDDE